MQKHIFQVGAGCSLFLLMLSNSVVASDRSEEDLFNMPLQQLLNISVVSKRKETFASSPGVVSAYDARELESLGLTSLIDFIHFVPGIEINEQLNELRTVQIRGLPSNSNQKVLFMLDGVPYWMPESGDIPLSGVPLQSIERIEVIRGPGSVIYGTNATAGVINIVLRKDNGISLRSYLTNENLQNTSMYFGAGSKNGHWLDFSAEIQRDEGYQYQVENAYANDPCFCFPETAFTKLPRVMEHSSFLAHYGFKDFKATFQSFVSEETGDIHSTIESPSRYTSQGMLVGLKYTHQIQNGQLEFFSDWNNYYRDVSVDNFLAPYSLDSGGGIFFDNSGEANTRFRNGLSLNYQVNRNFSILSGAEYEERGTENKKFKDDVNGSVLSLVTQAPFFLPVQLQDDNSILLVEKSKTYEKSFFTQGDYYFNHFRFTAGFRYLDHSTAGSEISPRGSIVYSLNETESFKLLYSEGFNAPTFRQSSATDEFGLPLNQKVLAEEIQTWDLAYTKTDESLHQVLSFFHIEARDLINTTLNSKELIKRNGIEYDLQYHQDAFKLTSGITYIHEGDGKGDDTDANFASRWLAKLSANYRLQQHGFSATLRSAGRRQNADAYHRLDLHYRYHISNQIKLFSTITNVLDAEVMHPDVVNLKKLKIQATDGIGMLIGIKYEHGN